jgi:uncharacterized membrane protein
MKRGIIAWINNLHSTHRLLISLALGLIAYFAIWVKESSMAHIMIGWDTFAISMLALSWINFFTTTDKHIRKEAKVEDSSRVIIFVIILISTFASFLAVLLLVLDSSASDKERAISLPIAIAGMLLSWLVVHTTFAYRYAHLFYASDDDDPNKHVGGLEFPGEDPPDFLDFAYFSFVIGMTFQVSDVEIASKNIRRITLLHSLIAFGFNTIVVALTINIIAGLGTK